MSKKIHIILIVFTFLLLCAGCKHSTTNPPARGAVWTTFTRENTPSLVDFNIHTIMPGSEDRIWFGTDSGAISYYHGTWSALRDSLTYITYGQGIERKGQTVTAIAEGQQGTLWFGTDGGGVRRYNRNNPIQAWQRYSSELQSGFITGIAVDKYRNGDVWVSTTSGISHYVPTSSLEGNWHSHSEYAEHFQSPVVNNIAINPANGWTFFATNDGVPYVYDDNGLKWGRHDLPTSDNSPILSITVDYSNTIWLGKMYGVTSWNPKTDEEHHYTNNNTNNILPNSKVYATTTDYYYKTRWFGTDMGLVRLQDTTWTIFNQEKIPELPSNKIQAIGYDKKGNLWIGTDNGIVVYNEGGFVY
jgi:ligand-binding sensor domain-containing protein